MLQGLFDPLRIKTYDELTIDFKSRYAHDLMGHECFPGTGILTDISFLIGDMLF